MNVNANAETATAKCLSSTDKVSRQDTRNKEVLSWRRQAARDLEVIMPPGSSFRTKCGSRNRKRPISDRDEPRQMQTFRPSVEDERRRQQEGISVYNLVKRTGSDALCSEDDKSMPPA